MGTVSFPECVLIMALYTLISHRLNDVAMWRNAVDGFICESHFGRSPSTIMSEYFGRPVHLIVKGNAPRPCDPTDSFPELKATTCYQDGYPLLVLSEESIEVLHHEIRARVGTQGIEDKWSKQEFVIERYLSSVFVLPRLSDGWHAAASQNNHRIITRLYHLTVTLFFFPPQI